MKTSRNITAFILAVIMLSCCIAPASAASSQAELLTIYADGMLFQQKEAAAIEGTATPGSTVKLELKNESNTVIQTSSATTGTDGSFYVTFSAPEGSFSEYSITLYENNREFRTLRNIVFGELWLASGQSNMQYPLIQSPTGAKNAAANKKLSYWLRVLLVPAYPEYKGSTSLVPSEPQNDITDSSWINGESYDVYSMSAVAYFFAEKLMEEIDMPVGILNSSLGGSSIRSWLSREAIDNTPEISKYLRENGEYIEKSVWDEAQSNVYQDMTANFNQKIAPLGNFSIAGFIWYQGETDLMLNNTQYDKQFDLLQKTFTEVFNYKHGLLPVVYTQLASYYYSDDGMVLSHWNADYCTMQKSLSDSRALITIYDVPVTYVPEAGLIHPERKEEVGERMAFSAAGLVYGKYDTYTAATVKGYEIKDNSVYITFDNTGDGLVCSDEVLRGFSICSGNGIFADAKAEIVSKDTIRVYSDDVTSPTGASYAYCVANQEANLYASVDSKPALPVAPFTTDKEEVCRYWFEKPWTYADSDKIWYTEDDTLSGYYAAWTGNKADVSFDNEAALEGASGIVINAKAKKFSVSPTLAYSENLTTEAFRDADTDYSYYGSVSFYVRNMSSDTITLEGVKFCKSSALWYAPAVKSTLDCATEIPADGEWHKITLDLNRIYHLGNECSLSYGNDTLNDIRNIEWSFSSSQSDAVIYLDEISFSPETESCGTRYDVDIKNADTVIEFFTAVFLTIFGRLASLFGF